MIVKLCKQLEELVTAVPSLKRFAYSLARESVGMKPAGRPLKAINGTASERLTEQLLEARARRNGTPAGGSRKGHGVRPPLTEEHKAILRRAMKRRWKNAKQLGASTLVGRHASEDAKATNPTRKSKVKTKSTAPASAPAQNGGHAAAE